MGFSSKASDAKEEIMFEIKNAFKFSGKQAQAYCRKFEDASDSDLESMLSDLALLDQMNEDLNVD